MTNVADLATEHRDDYARLDGIHMMAGSVSGPVVEGVAEWNAAADPRSLETVLRSGVPVTVVPADAVPTGTPEVLAAAPVVGRVVAAADVPAWWDLAAAAALVATDAGAVESGHWVLDPAAPGRLVRTGTGTGTVYRSMDEQTLASEYARVSTPA
jgi:inosine-uridine nucleoside N-ribohydrolase